MSQPLIGLLPSVTVDLAHLGASVADRDSAAAQGFRFVLEHLDSGLALLPTTGNAKPLQIDFAAGRMGYRLAEGRARQETLVRAVVGKHAVSATRVLDATAGLGRDAALLAAAGCEVLMLERNPVLAALLADALRRAAHLDWSARLTLLAAEACDYLAGDAMFDVVCLDPMFATHDTRAEVKKELVWLREILEAESDGQPAQLLQLARQHARRRVVVKRAAKAPVLAGVTPTASLPGKAIRFDIYTPL